MEESGPENINFISQIVDSYFMVREASEYMEKRFFRFKHHLRYNLEKKPKLVS